MTSSKTINIDNPKLNCRIKGFEKFSPKRTFIVITTSIFGLIISSLFVLIDSYFFRNSIIPNIKLFLKLN